MEDQCNIINIKQKLRIKIQQTSIDIFLSQTLYELIDYFLTYKNQDDNVIRYKPSRYYLPKRISRIMMSSSMERSFMTNPSILTLNEEEKES